MKVTEVINVPSRVKIRGFVPLRVLKIITDHQSVSFVVLNFKCYEILFRMDWYLLEAKWNAIHAQKTRFW